MRKNKSKLMAFSLLALCVACLAFGVYALKNATLTVSGTVGFTAHDCMVNVKAYIEGDGITADGTTATDGHPSEERALTFRNVDSNEITVGGESSTEWDKTGEIKDVIYFTDLTDTGTPAPITMTFKLTNLSAYDVYATIANETDLLAKGVTVVVSDEVVMQESNDTATDEAVLTAIFTLDTSKLDENGLMEGFELKLDFGKYVAPTGGEEGGEDEGEQTGDVDFSNVESANALLNTLKGMNYNTYSMQMDATTTWVLSTSKTDNTKYSVLVFEDADSVNNFLTNDNTADQKMAMLGMTRDDLTVENNVIYHIGEKKVFEDSRERIVDGDFVFYKDAEGNYNLADYIGTDSEVTLPNYAPDGTSGYVLGEFYNSNSEMMTDVQSVCENNGQMMEWFFQYGLFSCDESVEVVNIPASVTKIGSAFYGASGVVTVNIADGSAITEIGTNAFYQLPAFTTINLPNSLERIGEYAFYNCTALGSITLPTSLHTIENGAFSRGTFDANAAVNLDLTNVVNMGARVFGEQSNVDTVKVPFAEGAELPEGWNADWASGYNGTIIYAE